MATLRQAIQAKLDIANQGVASLESGLAQAESQFTNWMDEDVEAIKAKADALVAEQAKYL